MRRTLTFAGRALATAVVVVASLALLAGVLVPRLAGATPYTVLTDSMAPALPRGTLIVVRPSDDVGMGDVITFQLRSGEPEVATHRVVGVGTTVNGEPVYTTRGDANDVADVEQVGAVQVRGELWYHVPFLGYVGALLTGGQRQGIAVAAAAALVAYAAWQVVQTGRERRRKAEEGTSAPGGEADGPTEAHDAPDRKVAAE